MAVPSSDADRTTTPSPASLGAMVLDAMRRHSGPALREPRGGATIEWSFADMREAVLSRARGLVALGLEPGDRVAIFAATSAEWTLADCAALVAGLTVVPIYHTNSPAECRYVLEHSGARAVICDTGEQLAKVADVRGGCPALEHVIGIGAHDGAMSLEALCAQGKVEEDDVERRLTTVGRDDIATIVYTSGTTGPPKGCMLTHANCLWTMTAYAQRLDLRPPLVIFMFLPLAHALARITQMVVIHVGGTLAYWSGEPSRLVDDIAAARPTHFPSVPRVFEKVQTRALATVEDAGGPRRRIFDWALATGARASRHESPGAPLRIQHAVADRLVLSKIRGLFGGELRVALTGAAPIGIDTLDFFDACGIPVLEGYGLTESCAAATLNTLGERRSGTVGRALPGSEIALGGDGEVLLRGPNVFAGYFRDEAATEEALDGDWLRTGDLGELEDGFLRITGRKKELIITSSGKNITPVNIEGALRESRWISQAIVHGDNRPYLVALLTLDAEEAPALADRLGIPADVGQMAADARVHAVLQADVDAANERFARIEQVKRFHVLDHDLTQAAGELTPTLKVKRSVVTQRYRDLLDALYAD